MIPIMFVVLLVGSLVGVILFLAKDRPSAPRAKVQPDDLMNPANPLSPLSPLNPVSPLYPMEAAPPADTPHHHTPDCHHPSHHSDCTDTSGAGDCGSGQQGQ